MAANEYRFWEDFVSDQPHATLSRTQKLLVSTAGETGYITPGDIIDDIKVSDITGFPAITVGPEGSGAHYECNDDNFDTQLRAALIEAGAVGASLLDGSYESGVAIVELLTGRYKQKARINTRTGSLSIGNYKVRGAGMGKSIIVREFDGPNSLFELGGNSTNNLVEKIEFEDITIDQNRRGEGWGIVSGWVKDSYFRRVEFKGLNPGNNLATLLVGKFQGGSDAYEANNIVVEDAILDMSIPFATISSVNVANNSVIFTEAYPYLPTGTRFRFFDSAPAPLLADTTYFVIRVSDTEIKLASSYANAIANTPLAFNLGATASGYGANFEGMSWEFCSAINARNISFTRAIFRGGTSSSRTSFLAYNSEQLRMQDCFVDHQFLTVGSRGSVHLNNIQFDQGKIFVDQAQDVIIDNISMVTWGETVGFTNGIQFRGRYKTIGTDETPWYIPYNLISSIDTATDILTLDAASTIFPTGTRLSLRGNSVSLPYGLDAIHPISTHANVAAFPATGATSTYYIALDTGISYQWSFDYVGATTGSYSVSNMGSRAYYAIYVDSTHIKLAATEADALAGTAVNITSDIKGATKIGPDYLFQCENVLITNSTIRGARSNAIYSKTTVQETPSYQITQEVADCRDLTIANCKIDTTEGIAVVAFADTIKISNLDVKDSNTLNSGSTAYDLFLSGKDITLSSIGFDSPNVNTNIVIDHYRYRDVFGDFATVRLDNINFSAVNDIQFYNGAGSLQEAPTEGITLIQDADSIKHPVACATTAALATNTASSNSILTANANGVMAAIDGVTPTVGMRILVKNESSSKNGLYYVRDVGSVSTPWILKRTPDAFYGSQFLPGFLVVVGQGTKNAGTIFKFSNTAQPTVGATGLNFVCVTPRTHDQGNVTGTITFNYTNGSTIICTQTGNVTALLTDGAKAGDILRRIFTMGGAGSYTYTKAAKEILNGGAFVVAATVGHKTILTQEWDGTNWVEVSRVSDAS